MPLNAWPRRLLISVVLLCVGGLVVAPLVGLVAGALSGGARELLPALSEPGLLAAFGRTPPIAILVVIVHAVCGTALAWVLVRQRFRGRRWLNALIDLPFAVSAVVAGYMLLLLFGRRGLLAPALQALDLQVVFAFPSLVLATLFVTLPFMARELMPVLEAFGQEQEQAAATLGANGWQTFWLVTFPALRWGFVYGVTLTFARALGEFGAVLVAGGGITGRTDTATIFIFRALEERQTVSAYGAALVLGALSLLVLLGANALRGWSERR